MYVSNFSRPCEGDQADVQMDKFWLLFIDWFKPVLAWIIMWKQGILMGKLIG